MRRVCSMDSNILKPVTELGKIVSLNDVRLNSSRFEKITSGFQIDNNEIRLDGLDLQGIGLKGQGKALIRPGKYLHVRAIIALHGISGKVLRVPVVLRGVPGKSIPYISPFWMGRFTLTAPLNFIPGPDLAGYLGNFLNDKLE